MRQQQIIDNFPRTGTALAYRPMDWDWLKAFPQTLKEQFSAMKITVNWQKAWPAVFIAFLAG
ncbi:hypothetical protein MJI37_34815, partial [Salmonella enterica subsp. enterica serovar Cerro]|nr:hypothetical protein [Salmonella enterica subsp. enterica serovar Cerro]